MSCAFLIDAAISQFISSVATKFSIPEVEIRALWDGKSPAGKKASPATKIPAKDVSTAQKPATPDSLSTLSKMKRDELSALCRVKGLKTTGTKPELIARLSGTPVPDKPGKDESKGKGESKGESKGKGESESKSARVPPKLQALVAEATKTFSSNLKQNKHGNYEHEETHLVFDKESKQVIGKQASNGHVLALTDEDIESCNRYKFKYALPENLVTTKKNDVVAELGEDDAEELVDENDLEEELEEELEEDDGVEEVGNFDDE